MVRPPYEIGICPTLEAGKLADLTRKGLKGIRGVTPGGVDINTWNNDGLAKSVVLTSDLKVLILKAIYDSP